MWTKGGRTFICCACLGSLSCWKGTFIPVWFLSRRTCSIQLSLDPDQFPVMLVFLFFLTALWMLFLQTSNVCVFNREEACRSQLSFQNFLSCTLRISEALLQQISSTTFFLIAQFDGMASWAIEVFYYCDSCCFAPALQWRLFTLQPIFLVAEVPLSPVILIHQHLLADLIMSPEAKMTGWVIRLWQAVY